MLNTQGNNLPDGSQVNFDQLLENYQRLETVLEETNIALEEKSAALKEKDIALEEKEQVIEVKGETINKLQAQINQMQFQIDQMNRLLYGARRERFIANTDENQLTLPFAVEQVEAPEALGQPGQLHADANPEATVRVTIENGMSLLYDIVA